MSLNKHAIKSILLRSFVCNRMVGVGEDEQKKDGYDGLESKLNYLAIYRLKTQLLSATSGHPKERAIISRSKVAELEKKKKNSISVVN